MLPQLIFIPILVHIALVAFLYGLLLRRKLSVVKAQKVDFKETSLNCKAWPSDAVLKCSNNIDNQFQVPVLFYVVCFILYSLNAVTTPILFLAWTFVFSRYIHAYIHTGRNHVPHRMRVFALGMTCVVMMAAYAGWRLWSTTPVVV